MTKPMLPRLLMVAVACFQNFTCGGLIFGWAAISSSLLIAPVSKGGAELSRALVHQLFVIATSINFTAPLLLGVVLDAYGPRICSALSLFLVTSGFILFSASSPQFHTAVISISLIAFGGPGVQSSIIHLSNLYPASKATVTSIITGSFNLSFIIFFLFDRLWYYFGLDYQKIFAGYSIICIVAFIFSIILWPDQPFDYQEQVLEEQKPDQLSGAQSKMGKIRAPSVFKKTSIGRPPSYTRVNSSELPSAAVAKPAPTESQGLISSEDNIKEASFWEQLLSPAFLRVTAFIVIASFWANFYIGTIDIQLADSNFLSPVEQGTMVRLFTAITTAGVLGIPLVGKLMDNYGFVVTAVVTISMAVIYGLGVLFSGKVQLILAFIAYGLFRTFLFTYFFAFLADSLGFRYFGILAGISFLFAGCAGLLQEPLIDYGAGTCHLASTSSTNCSMGNWIYINYTQLACLVALYLIPLFDFQAARQQQKSLVDKTRDGSRSPYTARKYNYATQSGGATGGKLGPLREV